MQQGEQVLSKLKNLESGEIRIGASDMTLQFYLLPYLDLFHQKYPAIKVHVTNGPTPETLMYLKEGKIDFGVVTEPFAEDETMDIQVVREVEDIFVAAHRYTQLKIIWLICMSCLIIRLFFWKKYKYKKICRSGAGKTRCILKS